MTLTASSAAGLPGVGAIAAARSLLGAGRTAAGRAAEPGACGAGSRSCGGNRSAAEACSPRQARQGQGELAAQEQIQPVMPQVHRLLLADQPGSAPHGGDQLRP